LNANVVLIGEHIVRLTSSQKKRKNSIHSELVRGVEDKLDIKRKESDW